MTFDWSQPPPAPKTLEEAYQIILAMWQEMVHLREENAALKTENTALRAENAALKVENAELKARVAQLESVQAENVQLKTRIVHVEEQLKLNSSNSSKPPSSDPPWRKPPPKEGTKRPRGGQPGHRGQTAEFVPVDRVDHRVDVPAMGHCSCGGELELDWDQVDRRQVQEIPPIQPIITEYRRVPGCCRTCGRYTWPDWPAEALSALGPYASAVATFLAVAARLSKAQVKRLFRRLWQIGVSTGCLSQNERRVSQAVAGPVQEAHEYAKQQPIASLKLHSHRLTAVTPIPS